MEHKPSVSLNSTGIVLGFLGGVIAVLQSLFVLAYSMVRNQFGQYGFVGLGVAVLILLGTVLVYRRSVVLGALVVFFSSLIGQITGGPLGFMLSLIFSPPPSPIYNNTFQVSGYTISSLIGSILILLAFWKSRPKTE